MKNLGWCAVICTTLFGCQTMHITGNEVDVTKISTQMTRAQVIEDFGSPSCIPIYSPNTWYYVSRRVASRAFFPPKVLSQQIVRIQFTGDIGEISVIESSQKDIRIAAEATPIRGVEENFVQGIAKNLGRFNASSPYAQNKRR